MNDLRIKSVSFSDDFLAIEFSDGRSISVPLDAFVRLKEATPSQRNQWRLIGKGLGVHWEALDEDISIDNLLLSYSRSKRDSYMRPSAEAR
jgi:hypothetical protein